MSPCETVVVESAALGVAIVLFAPGDYRVRRGAVLSHAHGSALAAVLAALGGGS